MVCLRFQDKALKCGNCQVKRTPARTSEPGSRDPPEAEAHPMRGGMAPTTDPTHVLYTVSRFIGVYTPEGT